VQNDLAVAFPDSYPLSNGHTLIMPKRHEPDYFALSSAEQAAVFGLVGPVKDLIDEQHRPDGYNLGLNSGQAAGQTVLHAHLHVIPRYEGDVKDPRGGVRWVLPNRAAYWSPGSGSV
jgi:diadenosine tetraphosphate (Ap4A) HIT family hydrolase